MDEFNNGVNPQNPQPNGAEYGAQAPQQPQYQAPQQPQYQAPQGAYQQPQGYTATMVEPPKKKKSKLPIIIIAVVLVLAIIIGALASAGGSPEKKLYGNWSGELDATEQFLEGAAEVRDYLDGISFTLKINVSFNDDGTYSYEVDREAFDAMVENMYPVLESGMLNYLRDTTSTVADYTDDELIALLEKNTGENYSDYIRGIFADELSYDSIADLLNSVGNFKADGEKIWLSAGLDYAVDETCYYIYELEGENKMTFKEYYNNNVLDPDEAVIVFEKV